MEQRNAAIEQIMQMDRDTFFWKLFTNTLPDFERATESDADYRHIRRDTNHVGDTYAYVHRDDLRECSVQEFIDGMFSRECTIVGGWDIDEKKRNLMMRDVAMSIILAKPEEEWLAAVEAREVPEFVRAVPGDNDYTSLHRSPNVNSRASYYNMYRHTLRTTDLDSFIEAGKTWDI